MRCPRCKAKCEEPDNYCANCGAPMKRHIAEMVQNAYLTRRQKAVHNILNVLVKEGCIHQEKLNELMQKLEQVYGQKDLAEQSSAEPSVKTEGEAEPSERESVSE